MLRLSIVRRNAVNRRRGAVMPLIAVMLPVFLILASFVVNLAYMELTRTELRIASDAATRAAGFRLTATGLKDEACAAAREATLRNRVAGISTELADEDIVFGVSSRSGISSRYQFSPGGAKVNSVQVLARRDNASGDGAVGLVLPSFGGVPQFQPTQLAVSSQVELDIALVLDRSGSMAYGDYEDSSYRASQGLGPEIAPPGWWFGNAAPPESRWRALVDGVNVFFAQLSNSPQQELVALVTYSGAPKRESDLSNDYSQVTNALNVYTQSLDAGATNIGDGIYAGIEALAESSARPWAVKVIVLMTDGRHNTGSWPEHAARYAAEQGITVYTVSFSEDAQQWLMESVAKKGGGLHFHAVDAQDLKAAFKKIAHSLPTLLTQ